MIPGALKDIVPDKGTGLYTLHFLNKSDLRLAARNLAAGAGGINLSDSDPM